MVTDDSKRKLAKMVKKMAAILTPYVFDFLEKVEKKIHCSAK